MMELKITLFLLMVAGAHCQTQYEWRIEEYGECSATECGYGWRFRQITCVIVGTTGVQSEINCDGQPKPSNWQQCFAGVCGLVSTEAPSNPVTYDWTVGEWGTCSKTCGDGVQSRSVGCTADEAPVSTVFCEGLDSLFPKPDQWRDCNVDACPSSEPSEVVYYFYTADWEECSAECDGGIQTRRIICVGRDNVYAYQSSEEDCTSRGLEQPISAQACNLQPCDPTITTAAPTLPSEGVVRYLNGSFSACSASCGYATKSRRVLCVHSLNGVHSHVDDSHCPPGTKPEEIVVCQGLPPCSSLTTTAASDAMTTVAPTTPTPPVQTTMVQITTTIAPSTTLVYEQTTVYINDEATTAYLTDPSIERPTFVVGQYGECDCSSREKTRYVLCVDYRSTMVVMIADKHCYAAKQVRPDDTTACNANECPGTVAPVVAEWSTTGFDECSRTCGGGVRRRQVFCVDTTTNQPLSDDLCDADQRPQETEDCATNDCEDDGVLRGSFWSTGEWSDCNVTCGLGHQKRSVVCYYFEGVPTTEISTECDIDSMPSDTHECDMGRCHGYWVSTEWSECSASCGFGIQSRTVDCRWQKSDLTTIDESRCEGSKPDSQIGCKLVDCPLDYACDNMLKGSGGNISSPLYPANYPNDVTCKNVLVADSPSSTGNNSYIEINFQELEFEEETDCNFDYIEVHDVKSGVTAKICTAAKMPMKWTSQGNMVEVTFVSDPSINKRGYSASWKMMEN